MKEPEYYILPVSYVKKVRDPNNKWGEIVKNRLLDIEKYRDSWELMERKLQL